MSIRQPDVTPEMKAVIDELLTEMQTHEGHTDEYDTILKRLERLYKLKDADRPKRVSPDVALTVGANLVGILLILQYEQVHVVTSKALGFVMKVRS